MFYFLTTSPTCNLTSEGKLCVCVSMCLTTLNKATAGSPQIFSKSTKYAALKPL